MPPPCLPLTASQATTEKLAIDLTQLFIPPQMHPLSYTSSWFAEFQSLEPSEMALLTYCMSIYRPGCAVLSNVQPGPPKVIVREPLMQTEFNAKRTGTTLRNFYNAPCQCTGSGLRNLNCFKLCSVHLTSSFFRGSHDRLLFHISVAPPSHNSIASSHGHPAMPAAARR